MTKRVLVSPLNWGLGHATRCIPIIRELQAQGAEIIIGAELFPLALLQAEFPSLETVNLPGYDISYPKGKGMALHLARQVPKIVSRIAEEHNQLSRLIDTLQIDGVVSDNRYGLYSDKIPTVFVSHQVSLKAPLFEGLLYQLQKRYIDKYAHLWVPDFEGTVNLPPYFSSVSYFQTL